MAKNEEAETAADREYNRRLLEIGDWRRLVEAQEKLLVAYRLGRRPAGTTQDTIYKLKRKLNVS